MRTIKMAVVGLGHRGMWWLGQLLNMEDVEITAVCDKHENLMEEKEPGFIVLAFSFYLLLWYNNYLSRTYCGMPSLKSQVNSPSTSGVR